MPSAAVAKFQKLVTVLKDVVFLATLIALISTALGSFAFTLFWPRLIEQIRLEMNAATREELQNIQGQLNTLTGEDRVIRMPQGHSYVAEPVTKGEPIDLTLVLSRTTEGSRCSYSGAIPLFVDDRYIPFAGEALPASRQLSTEQTRLQLHLNVPDIVNPGRVGVFLSISYACPNEAGTGYIERHEETDTIFFQMDPVLD